MADKPRIFYGWIIVLTSFLMLWVTNGLTLSGLTVFDKPILDQFGWNVGGLKFRDFITMCMAGLFAPVMGAVADRIGVRPLMALSIVMLSVGYFIYANIQTLQHVYYIHVIFAAVLAAGGLVVNVMLVSRWFVLKRGTALGLILVGTSLGNALFPQINTALINAFGWRTAFQCAAVILLLMLPVIIFFIKEFPHTIGLHPLGGDTGKSHTQKPVLTGMAYAEALKTINFWAMAVIAMSTFYSILAFSAHLVLYMIGQGFSKETAAGGLGVLFVISIIGKTAFGYMADHLNRRMVFNCNLCIMFLGTLLLITARSVTFWPAIILVGFGWGGLYTLLQLMAVNIFGLKSSGKILGTITIMDAFGGGMGIWLTGVLYDKTGSYTLAFTIIAVLVGVAFLLSFIVKETQQDKGSETH